MADYWWRTICSVAAKKRVGQSNKARFISRLIAARSGRSGGVCFYASVATSIKTNAGMEVRLLALLRD